MGRIRLALFLVVVFAREVFADQITLKNGDRITGTIVSSDAKTLVIKTVYADDFRIIDLDLVALRESGRWHCR